MRVGSLFSGIGGLDLGLERAGMDVAWQVENDPYCLRVLEARWPNVPRFHDITEVDLDALDRPAVLAGGFPCQDISNAHTNGRREALDGQRSGLWAYFRQAVRTLEPRWAIIENVSAWKRWVPDVRADLAGLGYASVPLELSAGSFGAPHKRPRVFVVAHADGEGEPLGAIHAEVARLRPVPRGGGNWRSPPPGGLRVDDGVPDGMDRCRVIGNAVSPPVGEWLGRQVLAQDERQEAAA